MKSKYFKTSSVKDRLDELGVTESVILELDAEGINNTTQALRSLTAMFDRLGKKFSSEKMGAVSFDKNRDKVLYVVRVTRV